MRELPELNGIGKGKKHPKILHTDQISLHSIAAEISEGTSFGTGEVEGLIATLADRIARYTARGYSVKVDGIGIFSARLGFRPGTEPKEDDRTQRNAQSIRIAGLNFRPDRKLLTTANGHLRLERTPAPKAPTPVTQSREARLEIAISHLQTHSILTIREYATLTGLGRTAAGRELRHFRSIGSLSTRGSGAHLLYTLPDPNES